MSSKWGFISKKSIRLALSQKYSEIEVINYDCFRFVVRVTFVSGGKKYSRFVSIKKIAIEALRLRLESSLTVKTKPINVCGHVVLDDSGLVKYHCDYQNCQCSDYLYNDLDKIVGHKICKHTIASAKLNRISSTVSGLLKVLDRQQCVVNG